MIELELIKDPPIGWNGLSESPPDTLVEVIDGKGNKSFAIPTWYPFKVFPNPNEAGKLMTDFVACDLYWDDGWLINADGIDRSIGFIIGWRLIDSK